MKIPPTSSSTVLILLVVLCVDYLLATLLTSDPKEVWNWFLSRQSNKQALRNLLRCIGCGIAMLRTYWKVVPTFAIFKSCWGIKAVRPQKYTPMSVHYPSKK